MNDLLFWFGGIIPSPNTIKFDLKFPYFIDIHHCVSPKSSGAQLSWTFLLIWRRRYRFTNYSPGGNFFLVPIDWAFGDAYCTVCLMKPAFVLVPISARCVDFRFLVSSGPKMIAIRHSAIPIS